MFLDLYKSSEDETNVSYWVETKIIDKCTGDLKIIKAFCNFDKVTKKINFDPTKTDRYFLESPYEVVMAEAHLKRISKKGQGFPDEYYIETGG